MGLGAIRVIEMILWGGRAQRRWAGFLLLLLILVAGQRLDACDPAGGGLGHL